MRLGMLLFGVRNDKKVKEMLEDTNRIQTNTMAMVSENENASPTQILPAADMTIRTRRMAQ